MECIQELKAANRSVECSKQQLRSIMHFMVEQVRNPYQRMKLEASVAAVHEERTEDVMKIPGITTTSTTTAFTALRSQANAYIDDTVGTNYSTVDVSAQQVAQSDQNALLDRSVVRAAVALTTLYMYAFNTCQQTFQVIAAAGVSVQQALARQSCIIVSAT
jgi:putative lipase involved disintegration of autophagic bodies